MNLSLAITSDLKFQAYLISSLVHELTPAQEYAIFDAFHDDLSGDLESFRREVSRWRVKWSLEETKPSDLSAIFLKTQTKLCTQTFSYVRWQNGQKIRLLLDNLIIMNIIGARICLIF